MMKKRRLGHMTSFRIISIGFLSVILIGAILLMLPFATNDHNGASFTDALFTATSATCVTGLVLHDTATYWSTFGQTVILIMIQIGGMGIVTLAVAATVISGRKVGLMQRSTMQESISAHHLGGIVRLTNFIFKVTILIELLGAALLFPSFYHRYGLGKGIWYSLFHSVSAFCNAGFDLNGVESPYSSLTGFASDPLVNIVIMLLIIFGGIGFLTWEDIKKNKWHFRKYRLQSKVILVTSAILIILPAVYLFFAEFSSYPIKERVLASLFQSVTTRTAGFNTTDLAGMSETGQMLFVILMLIGGSPGSTAGGMKTTTIAVLFALAFSVFRHQEHAHIMDRRIPDDTARNAATIFLMYIVLFLGGSMAICHMEQVPMLTALFETASAIGTVGLTLGITPQLGLASQFILITLMFFGRVGGLTLIFAATTGKRTDSSKYPQEIITVG